MTKFGRSVLAASTLVLMSTAGAYAADLNGGSIKDSGYMPPMASRAAALYLRGDFSAGSTEFGSITEPPAYTHSDARISSSRFGGGGIGYYFSPSVRGDLTLDGSNTASARGTILDGVATLQGERQFGVRHLVGLANLYYDFDTRTRFTPYLGVGLGFAHNTASAGSVNIVGCDTGSTGAPNCAATIGSSTKTNAAGALMAGFSAKLADRWSLDAGYRFLYLGDAQTGDIQITRAVPVAGAPNSTPSITVHDMYDHQFRVGLRMDVR